MQRSPRNVKIASSHEGLTHYGGILFFNRKVREGMHTTFEVLALAFLATPCDLRLSMRHKGGEEARTHMFSMMPGTGSQGQIGFGDNGLFATAFFEVEALPRPCCVIPVP